MKAEQIDRMDKINKLIQLISKEEVALKPDASSYPFYSRDKKIYSKFVTGKTGEKLFFLDKSTLKKIYPYRNSKWDNFSAGGTMRALVECMRQWIVTGKATDYGCLYVPYWGSYWSLEVRQRIIDFGKEIGYLKQETKSYLNYLLSLPEFDTKYACDISQYRERKEAI